MIKYRVPKVISIQVDEAIVLPHSTVKYLDIIIDTKMNFIEQIRNTANRAGAKIFAICR